MLRFLPGNAQHIGGRAEQQDSFAFSDPADKDLASHGGLLGVVADGMGGLDGGRQASSAAVAALLQSYSAKTAQEPIPDALRRALNAANLAVRAVCRERGNSEGETGTTLAAAVVHNDSLHWISVGDTRLYVLRNGSLVQVNGDHNYEATMLREVAAGRSDRDQIRNDPRASQLTSYLGLTELAQVDASLRPFPLQSGDMLIACTDGVYRTLDASEIANAFLNRDASGGCEAVEAAAIGKRSEHQDNLTVIAVHCTDPRTAPGRKEKMTRSRLALFATKAIMCFELCIGVCLAAAYVRQHQDLLIRPILNLRHPAMTKAPPVPRPLATQRNKPINDTHDASGVQIPSARNAKPPRAKDKGENK